MKAQDPLPDVLFLVFLLGAIFFGAAALVDTLNRRESEPRILIKALANLQVGLLCLAAALAVLMPEGRLLLLGALILISGFIWLGYGMYLIFW